MLLTQKAVLCFVSFVENIAGAISIPPTGHILPFFGTTQHCRMGWPTYFSLKKSQFWKKKTRSPLKLIHCVRKQGGCKALQFIIFSLFLPLLC